MTEALSFINPNGITVDLGVIDGQQYSRGLDGRSMPPINIISQAVPEQDGARHRSTNFPPRQVTRGLTVVGTSRLQVRQRVETLASGLQPRSGVGVLRLTREDASMRDLKCEVSSFDTNDTDGEEFWQDVVAGFFAEDPFWYDTTSMSSIYTSSSISSIFPIFPLKVSSSTVLAAPTITNSGNVETWPVWTITGPGSSLVIQNLTTGKTLSLNFTIPALTSVIIDTTPGIKSVVAQPNTNLYQYLTGSLWSLAAGSNAISIQLNGSTTASSVQVSYKNRYVAA